jgi:hypothetical protein
VIRLTLIIGVAALLPVAALARAGAGSETLCVTVNTAAATRHYPAIAGDLLQIAFTHSIYGSRVEERFRITSTTFETVDARYSEPRLVDFYGFESASRDGAWWVAHPDRRAFQSLVLHASRDSHIRINFGEHALSLNDGAARVSLSSCSRPAHG